MAITLRNKPIELLIREIGQPTGEGPSAVIARLAREEHRRMTEAKERTVQERLAAMDALLATLPKLTDEERKAAWEDADRMFDYLYEDEEKPD